MEQRRLKPSALSVENSSFFARPSNFSQVRVENLFERLFKCLGHSLAVYDDLNRAEVLKFLKANYDLYLSNQVYQEKTQAEQTFWVSKKDQTPIVIEVSNLKLGFTASEGLEDEDINSNEKCTLHAAAADRKALQELYKGVSSCTTVHKNKIYLLANYYGDVALKPLNIAESAIDIKINYGEDFVATNDRIIESLNNKNSGLYLFYGEPGTGKSSYIKYLLSGVLDRKVVYVPINLINSLMSPDFLPLLLGNKNIILVIEDAEKALLSREESPENSSVVSAILNLTDSFISSTLNISIVATFNTAKENIDKALLRKGRLRHCHEFKKLSLDDAQKLVDHLNFDYTVTEDMTLADVYNIYENSGYQAPKEKVISGFGKG